MGFPQTFIQFSQGVPLYMYIFAVTGYIFKKYIVFHSLWIDFGFVNSADPDEIPPYAAFYLGFHCLQKYPGPSRVSIPQRVKQTNTTYNPTP